MTHFADSPHLFRPPSCQPIPPLLLLLLWLALGGGAWRGWCGTAWLSMGSKVVGFQFLPPFPASTRPAVLAKAPGSCCCCVGSPCGRGRAGRPCPAISPLIKVVCLTSPPSPREKEATAQATPKRRWYSDKSEKRASLLQENHLKWPNNQITIKPLLTL